MRSGELQAYQAKRDFGRTAEPRGTAAHPRAQRLSYVIQRHRASHLHFDFRLELDGVLKSWAIPKGPSLDPAEKRLAVEVEDHPLEYGSFEGSIPHGEYGGGYVLLWDHGTWTAEGEPHAGLEKGHLRFTLEGDRLHGAFSLVRMRDRSGDKKHNWLLIKSSDPAAQGKGSVDTTPPLPALESFAPELATREEKLPTGKGYAYEVKLDGYRALSAVEGGQVRILSRNRQDWSRRFAAIAEALTRLDVESAVFDGEICAVDGQGRTRFQDLQAALSDGDASRLVYFIFDLLAVDGFDIRDRPLAVRKAMLESILEGAKGPVAYVSHVQSAREAKQLFGEACRRELEGMVAKRLDRPYLAGRGHDWVKVKCQNEQEFVVVGYTKPRGSRRGLGALLLGVHEEERLRYVGRVGTGFSEAMLADLTKRLRGTEVSAPACEGAPRTPGATWVKPRLVCQVSFSERTRDGSLRHPSFVGIREDKQASEVADEKPSSKPVPTLESVVITHPDRIIDPSSGITKGDLAAYQEAVASRMLPFAAKRPLAIVRCPDHLGPECFFQKRKSPGMPAAIHAATAQGNPVIYVDSVEGLRSLVQFGTVEVHGWGSRLPAADKPDWLVLDLDPDVGLSFARVVEAALQVRELFESLGLKSFVKTTGGKGLHIVAPFVPQYGWATIKALAQSFAQRLESREPDHFTANMAKRQRQGKIFVDYLRNGEGATAILPYSTRSREGLPVAMPISWADLAKVDPRDLNLKSVPRLLRRARKDPWSGFFDLRQQLPAALGDLVQG